MAPPSSQHCDPTDASKRCVAAKIAQLGYVREEEADTDAGSSSSSGSDPESTCSSASASEQSEGGKQQSLPRSCIRQRTIRRNSSLPRLRAARAPPRGRFGGTPLSPIPGTPVAASDHPQVSFALPADGFESTADVQAALLVALEDAAREPSLPLPLPQTRSPQAPVQRPSSAVFAYDARGGPLAAAGPGVARRRAREAHAEKLRREGELVLEKLRREAAALPQKVELPALIKQPTKCLDPSLPAKKRPPFPEITNTVAVRHLQASEPVKKRVTDFLIASPPCNAFVFCSRQVAALAR